MSKNWMNKLLKLEGAVSQEYNPFSYVIQTPSPSVNFVFGNTQGLPLGFTLVMYGPPKGGKSVICNAMIGQMHRDYPDGIAIKFNTEMRELGQLTKEQAAVWGIDRDRYVPYDVNSPDLIFDRIETEIAAMCDDGMPLKLIVIDSLNQIQGRRAMNTNSVMTQNIGDEALTLQVGLKRILPIIRKHKIALILTAHIRAEMDMAEQMRGNKVRMAAAFAVQHFAEYFMYVEPNKSKAGRTDVLGKALEDASQKDLMDHAERIGHKIRVCMKDSSVGPKGRVGEFTLDYHKGIVNVHEEVFLLGLARGVIEKPNNLSFAFGDKKWTGKPAMVQALLEDTDLQKAVLQEIRRRDLAGAYRAEDQARVEESP